MIQSAMYLQDREDAEQEPAGKPQQRERDRDQARRRRKVESLSMSRVVGREAGFSCRIHPPILYSFDSVLM